MSNLLPNLETQLRDRSIGSIPLPIGSAGFVTAGQWGPVNIVMNITSPQNFKRMYSSAIYGQNHISWATINKYLEMGVSGAKIVRAGKNDSTTTNAVQLFAEDGTAKNWNNGTAQIRKLNANHGSWPSIEIIKIKLEENPTVGGWAVGDTISVQGGTATGTIDAIILSNQNESSNAFVYLRDYTGTFADGDTLTDGTPATPAIATIDGDPVETRLFNAFFHEVALTVGASQIDRVAVGSTIRRGDASGLVVGKHGTSLFLSNVVDTFTNGDASFVDDIELSASVVEISAVTTDDSTRQAIMFFAKYPGSVGNDIHIAMCDKDNFGEEFSAGLTFASQFEAPSLGDNEVAIIVTHDGVVVERWICSTDETAERSGESLFIPEWLDKYSNWIGAFVNTNIIDFEGFFALTSLIGGATGPVDLLSAQNAYTVLLDIKSGVRVSGDFHDLEDMSEYTDLHGFICGLLEASKRTVHVATMKLNTISETAGALDSLTESGFHQECRWVFPAYEWEFYNNADIRRKYWIPVTGTNIGIILRSVINDGDTEAPAGLRRGSMTGTSRLYYNLEEGAGTMNSELYRYGINANVLRVLDSGQVGFFLWGNRTTYNPMSDMSRLNVIQGLITDSVKLESLLLPFLFEGIDEDTYASIRQTCDEGYLANRSVVAFNRLDGDSGYKFTCGIENNSAQDVSEKTINIDFEVKYRTAAEYMKLRITVTGAGVEFQF